MWTLTTGIQKGLANAFWEQPEHFKTEISCTEDSQGTKSTKLFVLEPITLFSSNVLKITFKYNLKQIHNVKVILSNIIKGTFIFWCVLEML